MATEYYGRDEEDRPATSDHWVLYLSRKLQYHNAVTAL